MRAREHGAALALTLISRPRRKGNPTRPGPAGMGAAGSAFVHLPPKRAEGSAPGAPSATDAKSFTGDGAICLLPPPPPPPPPQRRWGWRLRHKNGAGIPLGAAPSSRRRRRNHRRKGFGGSRCGRRPRCLGGDGARSVPAHPDASGRGGDTPNILPPSRCPSPPEGREGGRDGAGASRSGTGTAADFRGATATPHLELFRSSLSRRFFLSPAAARTVPKSDVRLCREATNPQPFPPPTAAPHSSS